MSAIAWMLAPPKPPQSWPDARTRVHTIVTPQDEGEYSYMLPERSRPLALEDYKADLSRAAANVSTPRKQGTASERRAYREKALAEQGVTFAPLEPGQKRRRRIGPDGQPVSRKKGQRLVALEAGKAIVYRGPQRAPGEMTYGEAARLIHRANDGELVDLQDLARAYDTLREAREQGVVA